MKSLRLVLAVLAATVLTLAVNANGPQRDTKKKDPPIQLKDQKFAKRPILKGIKCPTSNKQVMEGHHRKYRGGTIYFCCGNCVKGFEQRVKRPEVAAKANYQLVATKQAKQIKCAVNGKGKLDRGCSTKIVRVRVHTCCKNCLGKLTKMEEKDQVDLVFDKNFEKSFNVEVKERGLTLPQSPRSKSKD